MKNTSNLLIGLSAGLAAGAALGILLAPDSGSGTRDRLNQSLKDLGDSVKERVAEKLSKFAELKDTVLEKITGDAEGAGDWQSEQEKA